MTKLMNTHQTLHQFLLTILAVIISAQAGQAQFAPVAEQSQAPVAATIPSSPGNTSLFLPVNQLAMEKTSTRVGAESTGNSFNAVDLERWEQEVTNADKEFKELEKDKSELLSVRIFSRDENRGLDFEKHHNEMLQTFTKTGKLLSRFEILSAKTTALSVELDTAKVNLSTKEANKLSNLQKDASDLKTLIDKSLKEVMNYRVEMNNQLIEDVHRYQIKNSFRSQVGIAWLICFLLICGGLIYLLKVGVLSAGEPSTLQLVAMILIVFVIVLFGIADVMGENGVTGLLAALAGYILGKSGTTGQVANLAEVIAAAQGRVLTEQNQNPKA